MHFKRGLRPGGAVVRASIGLATLKVAGSNLGRSAFR